MFIGFGMFWYVLVFLGHLIFVPQPFWGIIPDPGGHQGHGLRLDRKYRIVEDCYPFGPQVPLCLVEQDFTGPDFRFESTLEHTECVCVCVC